MVTVILYFTALINLFSVTSHTYYISSSGNDFNNGLSPKTAWRTIDKINQLTLQKGDSVLFEGGETFNGNLRLDENDEGDVFRKVVISSYGKGKATINAENETGIMVYNNGGITICNIVVTGNGVGVNKGSGIHFYGDVASSKLANINIENCVVEGFHFYGILIQSEKDTLCGFNNVNIINCIATNNGEAGIASLAAYPAIAHQKFSVVRCKAFDNRGILTKTDNHSGNGIVLSGVKNFLIDSCEAYENGADCRSVGGGPVGIWVWNCQSGFIRHSISHHNHSGTCVHDGGGFDIDGGSSNCTIRNCISYDNEGAGYLVCEFGSPNPFTNNLIINNSSRNDGLKNNYGAITISGAGKLFPVTNTRIADNKVVVENKNVVNGVAAALYFNETDFRNIVIENNSFEIKGGARVLFCDTIFTPAHALFRNNKFVIKANNFPVVCKKCKTTNTDFWKQVLMSK
ncbi:MAG: hypothetical protein ACKVOW_12535 [Chitinophagaceae bacterium]